MSGQIDIDDLKEDINKRAGEELAHNLRKEDPTEIEHWTSTGCFMLNNIIADGETSGIPSGKIVELAGQESTGKSFLSAMIAANGLQNDVDLVVYFDSEEAASSDFLEEIGVDLSQTLYVRAKSVEFVFETIEQLTGKHENILFIWDSVAMTGLKGQKEDDFGQRNDIAGKGRVMSKAFERVTVPLGQTNSTLLCTNQIRHYIPKPSDPPTVQYTKPYYTPGGKTLKHAYSLRIWLKKRDANSAAVEGEHGTKIGAEVKAEIEKSRFGSEDKECKFDMIWGDGIKIEEEPYWVDLLKDTDFIETRGAWHYFKMDDYEKKAQGASNFIAEMRSDEEFYEKVKEAVKRTLMRR